MATVVSAATDVFGLFGSSSAEGRNQVITIDPPDNGQITTCSTLHGSAPVKDGFELWVAWQGHGFMFTKATREEGDRWSLRKRIGGSQDAGKTFVLHAFYLNEQESRWLEGLQAIGNDGKPGTVHAEGMPLGAQGDVTRTIVHDGSGGAAC